MLNVECGEPARLMEGEAQQRAWGGGRPRRGRGEPLPDASLGEGTPGVPTQAAVKSGRPGPLAPNAATYEEAAPKQEPANEGKAEC